jgi:hypothetical protein
MIIIIVLAIIIIVFLIIISSKQTNTTLPNTIQQTRTMMSTTVRPLTYYGPYSNCFSDIDCDNLKNTLINKVEDCEIECDKTPGCTAFNFNPNAGCTLRKCEIGKYPSVKYEDVLGYSKYQLPTYYGPYSKVFSDNDCDNLKNTPITNVEDCKRECNNTKDCTAFNFNPNAGCTLRKCEIGKYPSVKYDGIQGYSKYQISPIKSNLLASYDASSPNNYIASEGIVSRWNDLSGNGYHLTQNGIGPTLTTINSVPAFNFNPNRGFLCNNVPLSTPITIFLVVTYKSIAQLWGSFMHHGDRDYDWAIEKFYDSNDITFQSNNDNSGVKTPLQNDKNYILVGRIVGNERQFWVYSDTLPPIYIRNLIVSITAGNKTLYVGKSNIGESCNSIIGEILYYNSSLSDNDINNNVKYLQNKWF